MDNVSEKLGLYDFFNVISVGAIFIIHILFLFPNLLIKSFLYIPNDALNFALWLVLSYLFGLLLQEIGSFVDEHAMKIKKEKINNFLKEGIVFDNNTKLNQYRKYAKEILQEMDLEFEGDFTQEQTAYIYGYIEYYIEHRNRNKKYEKMRALYGMSKSLFCCMAIILIISVFSLLYVSISSLIYMQTPCTCVIIKNTIILIYAPISMIIYHIRSERCMKYRIRMMMGVYESCIEAEKLDLSENQTN